MTDYDVSRPTGRCFKTGHEFGEGESFYSAVFETPAGLERRDFTESSWEGPPGDALCHFKAHLPKKGAPKKALINDEVVTDFFLRLGQSDDEAKRQFRFVLALILLRKRLLKYERTVRDGADEYWEMLLRRDKSMQRVFNPSLAESEIEKLTSQLGELLAGEVGQAGDEDALDVDAAPTGSAGA